MQSEQSAASSTKAENGRRSSRLVANESTPRRSAFWSDIPEHPDVDT